ncbi:alpha/beta fold hydrolase [Saccharothrix sp. NRRL B-16314]|uniref:alpha/beta fold hydrolase n=1 Tax=Saccharothrix sp. NRRL B-16314 TaxID=1463825 RepID=UPI000A530EC0|nr:alpha/beta hydrolase [Saccharothrix sp. NRRL B-16314]
MTESELSPSATRRRAASGVATQRILLLHGMAGSSAVWDAVLPLFAPHVEVWAADLPWRGGGEPAWSHHPDPAHWIADVLGTVPGGVDAVVAHSFSAVLTLELLTRQAAGGVDVAEAHGVRGMVLVSPFYRRTSEEFRFEVIGKLVHEFELAMREGIRTRTGRRIDEGIHAEMTRLVCERVGPYGWLRFLDSYLRTPWLRPELLGLPCTTIAGCQDRTAPPAEARVLADALPAAQARLFEGCGHFPMIEQPAAFASTVDTFLESLTVPAGTAVPVTGGRQL